MTTTPPKSYASAVIQTEQPKKPAAWGDDEPVTPETVDEQPPRVVEEKLPEVIMPFPVRQKQAEKKKFKQPQSSLIDSTSRAFSVILVAFDDNRSVAVTTNKYVCAQHLALINASSTFALQEFLMTLQDHEVSSHTLYLEGDFPGTYLSFKLVQSRLLEYLAAHCHGEIMAFISMNVLPLHVFTPVTISDREADARVVSTFMISEFARYCRDHLSKRT